MKTIKEQFVTYEISLAMKELGFNEMCIATFDEDEDFDLQNFEQNYDTFPSHIIAVPLWQQCVDWFREKYNYDIQIKYPHTETNKIEGINSVFYDIEIYKLWGGDAYKVYKFCQISDNYKCAREQAILKCIELCQKK